ncbi:TIGR00730 family Rossman fold protein [Macrococcus hajekii]|uniref:Cytokinin riboside 5'-monophosphate phosphoribohydrolase n=1 Tax=Macrococcus hajekii TaxID=198482 RepID=A0A4R6BJ07_9STAP|nr:TIGR00730 family Rossman fold protein [Macrococcus hajekii]TDM01536.1 TIGR00730 family Rossman fold protein [Macrococcus hajekii]GGB00818.1 cytokinin riboside 5'-monophosphate phosphoribohydrolase [Macrococcus hajekii]
MKSVAVFCGSRSGSDIYTSKAQALGRYLADNQIRLVYGGGNIGLMGIIADSVIEHGGEAIGVIPQFLCDKEVAHKGLTELHIVDSMHERKKIMADLSDGFIMMPGGAGTLEEFFEIFTWAQLDLHTKPIGIYNIEGYYDTLNQLLIEMHDKGFLDQRYLTLALFADDPAHLIEEMTL